MLHFTGGALDMFKHFIKWLIFLVVLTVQNDEGSQVFHSDNVNHFDRNDVPSDEVLKSLMLIVFNLLANIS